MAAAEVTCPFCRPINAVWTEVDVYGKEQDRVDTKLFNLLAELLDPVKCRSKGRVHIDPDGGRPVGG